MKKLAVAIAIGLSTQAFAGPFGLSQGLSITEVNKLGQFDPGDSQYVYVAKTIVSGHSDFDTYSVLVTPNQGLCSVVAISKDMYTNAYGHQLKLKFRELTRALSDKYGNPRVSLDISRTFDFSKNFDFWNLDGMWIEDNTWVEGLLNKTRTLSAKWEGLNSVTIGEESVATTTYPLPDALSLIRLDAFARSTNRGFLRLEYRFNNYRTCIENLNSKKNSNL